MAVVQCKTVFVVHAVTNYLNWIISKRVFCPQNFYIKIHRKLQINTANKQTKQTDRWTYVEDYITQLLPRWKMYISSNDCSRQMSNLTEEPCAIPQLTPWGKMADRASVNIPQLPFHFRSPCIVLQSHGRCCNIVSILLQYNYVLFLHLPVRFLGSEYHRLVCLPQLCDNKGNHT